MAKKLDFEFLAIDKRLLGKGLSPIELLVYSQVAEYNRTTGDCFISDKALGELFGVSESTVSRAVSSLVNKKLIVKETKNVKGGRERHMYLNTNSTTSKMTVDGNQQASNCCLTNVNLPIDNKQNEFIKEKEKNKEKENNSVEFHPTDESSTLTEPQEAEGTIQHPIPVAKEWLVERYNELYQCANGVYRYNNKFYKIV